MRCCELEWQSCNAGRRDCGSARVWWPGLLTAKPPTRGALPWAFPFLEKPLLSSLEREERTPPEGVKGSFPPEEGGESNHDFHTYHEFKINETINALHKDGNETDRKTSMLTCWLRIN